MITLYQFHWSHYVEKVRWALDYKELKWRAIDVDPYTKREMKHLPCRTTLASGRQMQTVPAIQDDATGTVVGESSQILAYLERQYPTPALYPESKAERDEVARWLPWLDSEVGLGARRVAYTQIALEHRGVLAELMLPHTTRPGDGHRFRAKISGAILGGMLTQRFRFDRNRNDRVYEQLEQNLLFVARHLRERRYLVGERFTAADLALAALLRPTTIVPFLRNHPGLQKLYEWRAELLREHRRELRVSYETALQDIRLRRGWSLGSVTWLPQRANDSALTELPANPEVRNDQQRVSRRPLLSGPLWYFRLRRDCPLGRTPEAANAR